MQQVACQMDTIVIKLHLFWPFCADFASTHTGWLRELRLRPKLCENQGVYRLDYCRMASIFVRIYYNFKCNAPGTITSFELGCLFSIITHFITKLQNCRTEIRLKYFFQLLLLWQTNCHSTYYVQMSMWMTAVILAKPNMLSNMTENSIAFWQ